MNVCELNKFITKAEDSKVYMDSFRFDPIDETATISKGSQIIVIDLTKTTAIQESEFQTFIKGLG